MPQLTDIKYEKIPDIRSEDMMKKIPAIIVSAACTAAMFTTFAACGGQNDDNDDTTSYTVSFETNGGSEIASQTVEEGGYAVRPEENPEKDGSVFGNWYADEALSELYEFETTAVTKDTTIYASWLDASNALTANFYWNYEGAEEEVYYTVNFESGERIGSVAEPKRDGYAFGGWFTEDGEEFSPAKKYEASVDFYASWQTSYTFEAEYTQLTGLTDDYPDYADANGNKLGYNFSGSANGTSLIKGDNSASGGKYVSGLYYRGGYLEFVINSETAVENAQLRLVLGCEYADITLSAKTYRVTVNDETIAYTAQIKLGNGSEVSTNPGIRGSWQEVNIGNISLKEGENIIRLTVNNSETPAGDAGTVDAASPMVDCIKIITDAKLTMEEYNK